MKRRYLILAIGFVAFAVIVLGVLAMLPPRSGVTKANFDRIQNDVTTAEDTERLFGYRGQKSFYPERRHWFQPDSWELWVAEDGSIAGVGCLDGIVVEKFWQDSNETTLGKLRRRLHFN